ncbi:MAG: YihY/virulence factor BrkB family protein [Balneolaceae bacterium]
MRKTNPGLITLYKDIKELVIRTFTKAIEDDIITQGAAIAFYTIFSIAPLFILIISLSGIFLSEEIITAQIQEYMAELAGEDIASSLNDFLLEMSYTTSGFWTTIIAALTVAFGATTVIAQLKFTLNRIWNVADVEMNSIWNFLLNRILSIGMIILISLLLLASLLAEAVVGIISGFFVQALPNLNLDIFRIISELSTIGFAICFFTLIFKILPDVNARWVDILVGGLVTTALFILGKYLIGLYFTASGVDAAYRAAGSLVIFVVWVYYNIQTILLGAVFTQVYTDMFGGKILPYKFVIMREFGKKTE